MTKRIRNIIIGAILALGPAGAVVVSVTLPGVSTVSATHVYGTPPATHVYG
jgi:hypothetical protein